jgi:hypothetical protein
MVGEEGETWGGDRDKGCAGSACVADASAAGTDSAGRDAAGPSSQSGGGVDAHEGPA